MKKLLSLILVLTIVGLGLYMAFPTSNETEDIGIIIGLNGQESEYTIQDEKDAYQGVKAATDLDKTKLPTYLFDIEENKLSFKDVGTLLKAKYYNYGSSPDDYFRVGFQTKMRMNIINNEMTIDEFIARTILLVEELSLYQYWLIGGSELYLQLTLNDISFEIFIYMPSLLSDGFNLIPEDYYLQNWEIEITGLDFENTLAIDTYYDDFVLNETFIGFILLYE